METGFEVLRILRSWFDKSKLWMTVDAVSALIIVASCFYLKLTGIRNFWWQTAVSSGMGIYLHVSKVKRIITQGFGQTEYTLTSLTP